MPTQIDVLELVAAFRAQEQERLATRRAEEQQRLAESVACRQRNLAALQAIEPQLNSLVQLLPGGTVLAAAHTPDGVSAVYEFAWTLHHNYTVGHRSYTVSRRLAVFEDAGGTAFHLSVGAEGGFLECDAHRMPPGLHRNPADLLVLLARYAGRCQANQSPDGKERPMK